MDREVLMHQMRERFEEEFAKALQALEDAPDGHWIDASEMAFRDAALTVAREGLELAVQARVDADVTAQAAAFSPQDPALSDLPPARNKGIRALNVLTATGVVTVNRRYFWSKATGGLCPVDALVGIQDGTVTAGARCILCTLGVVQDFKQAAEDLYTVARIRVSAERLRQVVEAEGRRVMEVRLAGALHPGWSASGMDAVYLGVDGVMVRGVTESEKQKRRRGHQVRRDEREQAGRGSTKPLPAASSGTTETFKEMKIGVFYDKSKAQVFTFASGENHVGFGRMMEKHADQLALAEASTLVSITDGAPWIRNRILEHLPYVGAMLLDFYHLSEHIWDTAKCCLSTSDEARAWAEDQLHEIKQVGPAGVLAAIATLSKKVRSNGKKERLRSLRNYLTERWEMLDYRRALSLGWDIGSGPTEAMCKNLTLRLKRTGMKWDPPNAAAVMNLVALRESGQWDAWWTRSAA